MTHKTKLDSIYTGDKQTSAQANWYADRKDDPEFKKKNQEKSAEKRKKKKSFWEELTKDDVCEDCGKTQDIEYHHIDPSTKSFNLGDGKFLYGREKLICEKAKCIPLCKNCHKNRHKTDILECDSND